jgi:hypothetical protein
MAYVYTGPGGYGPPIGQSREGYPIYLYTDPQTRTVSYVVVLPDGRAYYSDFSGRIGAVSREGNAEVAGALVLGTSALLLGGPVAGILGAIAGAIAANQLSRKRAA